MCTGKPCRCCKYFGHHYLLLQNHHPQNLFQQLRPNRRRNLRMVLRRIVFDDICPDDLSSDGLNMRQHLSGRHPSRLAMRNAGRKGRVEHIHVERNVDRPVDLHAVERGQMAHLDHFDAEFLGLLALMSVDRADAHLDQPLRRAFLHDAGKRASVGQPVAFEFVIEIGMGIEVNDGQAGNVPAKSADDRQRNRMVSAQAYRTQSLVQQFAHSLFDRGKGLLESELQISGIAVRNLRAQIDASFRPRIRRTGIECHANDGRRSRRPSQPGRVGVEGDAENRRCSRLGCLRMNGHGNIPPFLDYPQRHPPAVTGGTTPRPYKPVVDNRNPFLPPESGLQANHPLSYRRPFMATSTRHTSGGTPSASNQTYERERVFGLFRHFGYLEAELNPLGLLPPQPHPDLRFDNNNDNEWVREARRIYCGSVGVEFLHIADPERRQWIQEHIEADPAVVDQERALDMLLRADLFEQTLQQRYLGNKRFSLEGSTSLLPAVDQVLDVAGERGAVELVMGMSHRGRLNVVIHLARRPPEQVFAEFEDVDPRSVLGSGDVKYHMGATGEYVTASGKKIHIHLASNPSHLEAVDPVTVGRTRAKQDRAGEGGDAKFLPVLVHGDAAFAGQGITAETLNYADLGGYTVGGTIHVIVNNLVGFTTNAREEHSSRFSAQLGRRQAIPIFHVNGEDVDAVMRIARIATEYRYKFGNDVIVDLIGYRRHGHSEVDDPTVTQPLMYKAIKAHPPLYQIYARQIGIENIAERAQTIKSEYEAAQKSATQFTKKPVLRDLPNYWDDYFGAAIKRSMSNPRVSRAKNWRHSPSA